MRLTTVIPCRDEADSIAAVVAGVLRLEGLAGAPRVVVVDNGSSDATARVAAEAGATVVLEPHPGYGWACHAGVREALAGGAEADLVIAFLDGDGSMPPSGLPSLIAPIAAGTADLVCGRRRIPAATMPWHQRAGNELIGLELRTLYGLQLHELGPFRAIRGSTLAGLRMPPSRYAWAAEMLARAAATGARVIEVEVPYAARSAGESKVGGSLRGSLLAAWDICGTLAVRRLGR